MRKRRFCRTNARSDSVQVFSREPDKRLLRWSLRSEVHKGIDGIIGDGFKEIRFPVVPLARREETVEHRLHLDVRNHPKKIGYRGGKRPQWFQHPFTFLHRS